MERVVQPSAVTLPLGGNPLRLLISAGEASGDAYAQALVRSIRSSSHCPSIHLEGIGGPLLRAEGTKILADSSRWGAMGVFQSIKVAPKIFRESLFVRKVMLTGETGLFIPIDFGFLNIRLCRVAKAAGWKVLYFIPPSSWKRGPQGRDLPELTDEVVTPFQWSAEYLSSIGCSAHWFGHPLLDLVPELIEGSHREGFALLPGSRIHEVALHLPLFAKANLAGPLEISVAPNLDREVLEAIWAKSGGREATFTVGSTTELLQRRRVAVVCSGTAVLQAAITRTPSVLVYALSPLMQLEADIIGIGKKLRYAGLPNLILDRMIVPELIGQEATSQAIYDFAAPLLMDSAARREQLEGFDELLQLLGPKGCINRTAELAINLMNFRG